MNPEMKKALKKVANGHIILIAFENVNKFKIGEIPVGDC